MPENPALVAILVLLGYLAGSIPVGVIVARLSGGPDPRTVGSGRTGGTNALRALGRKWAAMVVAGDLAEGALPGLRTRYLTGCDSTEEVLVAPAADVPVGAEHAAGPPGHRPRHERRKGDRKSVG